MIKTLYDQLDISISTVPQTLLRDTAEIHTHKHYIFKVLLGMRLDRCSEREIIRITVLMSTYYRQCGRHGGDAIFQAEINYRHCQNQVTQSFLGRGPYATGI